MIMMLFSLLIYTMSYRKIYSYDDLDLFSKKYAKIIANIYKELNKDKDIIHPTEEKYKKLLQDALNEVTDVDRCLGKYLSGKNKNQRCQASPHGNSKYCLRHTSQNPENKQLQETDLKLLKDTIELINKNNQIYESDLKILKDAVESIKKNKKHHDSDPKILEDAIKLLNKTNLNHPEI
jgi:hypothetical protein